MAIQPKNPGKLYVISGPSGAGKGTIVNGLMNDPEINMALSVSMTTREPRTGEEEGVHYFFVSKEQFETNIENDGFLEYAKIYDNYYGTPKAPVLTQLEKGVDVILEIEMQGAMMVKKNYPDGVFIFVLPPSLKELRRRLAGRGTETKEAIEKRLGNTENELKYIEKYDYCVVNDIREKAISRVKEIIGAEHSKVTFTVDDLIEMYQKEEQ